ncbi:MAG: hypothetical protein IE909_12235 [Campylobacterales bacterium]|nr:hypothetical protein [Campylobacterales bacterium]
MVVKNIIIFFFILEYVLFATELDIDMLKQSDRVEYVVPKDGTSYFEYSKTSDNEIVSPNSYDRFELDPKIKFYNSKKGVMAIVPLAENYYYFNGSFFDTIKIKGECKNCTVAISDKTLFEKEDNIEIGKFEKKLSLIRLNNKIDFRKLKYIIFFAPKEQDIDIKKIVFLHTPKEPQKIENGIWIWSSKDVDIDKIKRNKIKTVYLQVDDGFMEAAELLSRNGIDVYALDGDPNYIFNDEKLMINIKKVLMANQIKNIVKGFQIDIEPHILKGFNLHKDEYIKRLIALSERINFKLKENHMKFSIVMPFWYETVYVDKKSAAYDLIDIADEVVLMSYRTDPNEVLKISADKLAYAQADGKKVKLGIELMPIADEHHFVYDANDVSKCKDIASFPKKCKEIKPIFEFDTRGETISFYNQKDRIKDLTSKKIKYNSFNGFVYHHIGGL